MLKNLPGRIQRPHDRFRRSRQLARLHLLLRHIFRIVEFCRILIPGIVAGVEIGVPHQNARMRSVIFQIPFHVFPVGLHFILLVGRHRIEIVKALTVGFPQIEIVAIERMLPDRRKTDRVVIQLPDMGDILRHGIRIGKIGADPFKCRIGIHSQADLFSIQPELAVFHPELAEAEIGIRQSIGLLPVDGQGDRQRVKIRIFAVP